MKTKKIAKKIINILREEYPNCRCSLDFSTSFQMVIAVMLSAQCTDERVNKVTPSLFKKYPTPFEMAEAKIEDLEKMIYSCGFYKNKAKHMKELSKVLVQKYNGNVPNTMKELQKLPGVGRKSANVVMLEAFHDPQGIAIDTHAKRICNRIGFSNETDPEKIEQDLLKIVDKEDYFDANHLFVWHGRLTCDSRKPKCQNCPVNNLCDYYKK